MDMHVETIIKNNLRLEIFYDEYTDSPREWDNLGIMALKHSRYNLSNEINVNMREFDTINELEEYINENYDVRLMLGVSMYDHSGVSLSLCNYDNFIGGWDTSLIGLIFIENNEMFKQYYSDYSDEKLEEILQNEVDLYSQYLNGEIYRYELYDDEGNEIDSCSSFYSIDEIVDGYIDWGFASKESNRIKNNVPYNQLEIEFA